MKKRKFVPLSSNVETVRVESLDSAKVFTETDSLPKTPNTIADESAAPDDAEVSWASAVLYEFAANDPKRKRAEKALATLAAHQYRKRDAVEQRMTLTLRDVSHMLQISERTVRRYIASGKLRAVKIGREYRITIDEYDAFVSSS
jgi:excisionase family DNA binding protein